MARTRNRARDIELRMLVFAVALCLFGYALVGYAVDDRLPGGFFTVGGGLAVLAGVAHLAVRKFAPYADPLILPVTTVLSGLGLVLIHRLDLSYKDTYNSPPAAGGQVMWTVIGVTAFTILLAVLRDYRLLQRYVYITALVALVLLMAPAFFPGDTYGAKRWIRAGALSFQPGEFVKIIITVFFAAYLTMQRDALALTGRRIWGIHLPRGRQLGPIVTVWVFSLLVLVFERDLGTSLIFFGVFVAVLYIATERTSWVLFGLLMAALGAAVVGSYEPHVHGRVVAWLHPFDYYLPPGQRPAGLVSDQAAQALFSFGSGGILGSGLGRGHSELIAFAGRSDFIITAVGEELGLAGMMAVLLLYLLLAQRGLRTALEAGDAFGKLLAAGLACALVFQVFVVVGGVTGLMPLTGKALPFLAQGGSSVVANWLVMALLVRISDGARRPQPKPGPAGGIVRSPTPPAPLGTPLPGPAERPPAAC
jgi:cell division protein FtsW (lipid II flippase)